MKVEKEKWEKKTFQEIAKSQLGKTLDAKRNTGDFYPYLCAVNVGYGKFNLEEIKEIRLENNELEKYRVLPGDLLICEGGETGRCAIWNSDEPIYYQNALHRVRFNDGVNNRFIMYVLHYYKRIGIIDKLSHGQTIKHFTQKGLNRLTFSLPTEQIQRSIASELDSIQSMIDGYKSQFCDLDKLAESIFLDMFETSSFPYVKFEQVCKKMMSGPFGTLLHKSDYVEYGGVPQINPQDIKNGFVVNTNMKYVREDKMPELQRYLLKENDIVIARRGDLGKCSIVTKAQENWLCGTGSCVIQVNDVLPIIFYFWFTSAHVQNILNENVIGTTMPNLNQKKLKEIPFPLIPLSPATICRTSEKNRGTKVFAHRAD